jgi:hypothetical protein
MSSRRVRLSFVVCSIALLVAPAAAANGPLGGVTDPVTKVVTQVVPAVAPVATSPVVTQPIATTAATPVQTATGTATAAAQTAANVATTASTAVKGATSAVAGATSRVAPSVPVVSGGVAASSPATSPKATVVNDKTTITPKAKVDTTPATGKKVAAVSAPAAVSPVPAPVVRSTGSETVTPPATDTHHAAVRTVARAHVAQRPVRARVRRRRFVLRISPRHGVTRLVAELLQQVRVEVLHTPPVASSVPVVVHATAAPVTVSGGRLAVAAHGKDHGLGFNSPLGRFAISGAGVLLGGTESGAAKVSLVLPGGLVGLAALIALAAVLGQRRAEHRRRVLR